MASIRFFTEDILFSFSNKNAVRKWLKHIILSEQHFLLQLNYIFCSDNYLLEINSQYLNHNYFTDVITFNNSSDYIYIEGDIFISIERVIENSITFHTPFDSELLRVILHGLLHLLGYDDHDVADIKLMREKEIFYLSLINF
jgi:rRNA maturation RNase YbeY